MSSDPSKFLESVIIKRTHPDAILPTNSRLGFYLYAAESIHLCADEEDTLKIGWSFKVPDGHYAKIIELPKSRILIRRKDLDMEFIENLTINIFTRSQFAYGKMPDHVSIEKGEKVAQIIFEKVGQFHITEIKQLPENSTTEI